MSNLKKIGIVAELLDQRVVPTVAAALVGIGDLVATDDGDDVRYFARTAATI